MPTIRPPHTLTMWEVNDTVHLKSKIVVLHKYLNNEQTIFCLLQFSPDVTQNSIMIPRVFLVHRNHWLFHVCGQPVWKQVMSSQPLVTDTLECAHTWVSSREAMLQLESRPQDASSCSEAVHHGTLSSLADIHCIKAGPLTKLLNNSLLSGTLMSRTVSSREHGTSVCSTFSPEATVQQSPWQLSGRIPPLSELMNSVKKRRVHSYPCCNRHRPWTSDL